MSYLERKELYQKIEKIRGRPLLIYITSPRFNAPAQIASDIIPEFAKQILEIPKESKSIDLLIVSLGGDPTVSWRLICMLRERFDNIGVLLPYVAYSAATLIALGADEIIMHPFGNLGPVDPQLTYVKRNPEKDSKKNRPEEIQFGSEDLRHYIDFIKTEVGISDQEQMERAFEMVCKDVGSIPIGIAKRSSHLALSMGEKLLKMHMKDESKAKVIAEALNKSFYHHGYPLGRREAKEIGLAIGKSNEEIEELMWTIWLDFEKEMECTIPFNPVHIVLNDPQASEIIGPVHQVQIPGNLPPQLLQQAFNTILSSIRVVPVPPIEYEVFQASLESVYCCSQLRTKVLINAMRLPDMNIAVSVVDKSGHWQFKKTDEKGD